MLTSLLSQRAQEMQDQKMQDLYDTKRYYNVRSKADMSQLNLPHGTSNLKMNDEMSGN